MASTDMQHRPPTRRRWGLSVPLSALERLGILGINRWNAEFTLPGNPRALLPRVDDKLITKELCRDHGIPVPETFSIIDSYGSTRALGELVADRREFVIKPARGAAGRGIAVVKRHSSIAMRLSARRTRQLPNCGTM